MKIPNSVRLLYEERKPVYNRLKERVDELLRTRIGSREERWHYESRTKELQSYALKLETGRYENPEELEDFFACTIVVENQVAINRAAELITTEFDMAYRRPESNDFTHKKSDSFPFDDLRLYVRWRDDVRLPPSGFQGILFEAQVKTFLSYAWGRATHDLVYKTDGIDWSKERIAYQIKAMLEHAEIAIAEASLLSQNPTIKKTNEQTDRITRIMSLLRELWDEAQLPNDVLRLSQNVDNLLSETGIRLDDLRRILESESRLGRGTQTLNLSPYGIIVQSIINQQRAALKRIKRSRRFKIFVPRELEIQPPLTSDERKGFIILR